MNPTVEIAKPEASVKKVNASAPDSIQAILNLTERVGGEKQNKNVIQRAIGMLTQPEKTWREIAKEEGGLVEVFLPYTLLTKLAPSVIGSVISMSYFTVLAGVYGYGAGPTMAGSLFGALQGYISAIIGLLVFGKIMEVLAPNYGARKSWVLSCRVLVYASTPSGLLSIFWFLPFLNYLIGLAGAIWSLTLFFQGYKILLKGETAVAERPGSQN